MTNEEHATLAQLLEDVSLFDGVEIIDGEIVCAGKRYNNYLALYALSTMIKSGDCRLTISGEKADYLRRILHEVNADNKVIPK